MSTELEKDIASLKKDLGKFRNDISDILSDAGHFSQDKIYQTKEKLKTAMQDFEGLAAEKISHAGGVVHEKTGHAVDTSREMVIQKPLITVMVSFAAGVLTAFFLGKNCHQ